MKRKLGTTIILFIFLTLFSGCGFNDTDPTEAIEKFFWNYQNLDESAVGQLQLGLLLEEELSDTSKELYLEAMKRQYENLTYDIKDVQKFSNTAVASVVITVYDFNNTEKTTKEYIETAETGIFVDPNGAPVAGAYERYLYNEMSKEEERVTYNITVSLIEKDSGYEASVLSSETLEMIQGLYSKENSEEETE